MSLSRALSHSKKTSAQAPAHFLYHNTLATSRKFLSNRDNASSYHH